MSKITVENGVLRNIAITGIKSAEDYLLCVKYCEENNIATGDIAVGKKHRIFYDNGDKHSNFYDWERQAYSHCHLVTMDQFKQALKLSKI